MLVVDSIQSVFDPELTLGAGKHRPASRVRAEADAPGEERGISVFLIGHVTKEGVIAGPKVLEHMVDACCTSKGERFQAYRLLRGIKNRFGSTNEVGVFEMRGEGLVEVSNPSARSSRSASRAPAARRWR